MEALRNMWRRKLRTALTIFGIVIGVFALTVMGSMAEKMNHMMDGGIKYMTGQISVTSKSSTYGGGIISAKTIREMRKVKGVDKVQPSISLSLDDMGMVQMGMPAMIIAEDLSVKFKNRNWSKLEVKEGRLIKQGDRKKVTLGVDLANEKKLKVGEKMKIKGENYKVVGILEKTLTGPDKMAYVSLKDAQDIVIKNEPFLKNLKKRDPNAPELKELYNGASVSWKNSVDAEKLSKKLKKEVDDIKVESPKSMEKTFVQATAIFNLVILGSALIAIIVGGLSVINTMIMSISERTREIGVKKAMGAKTYHVVIEYLSEAALIGLIGGLIGLGFGALTVNALNAQATAGNEIFLLSERLGMGALIFATFLGVFAGIYPAIHAARLNPVDALKAD